MDMSPLNSSKIQRISMVEQVAIELKKAILNQEWKVGDCLPSEAELASHFGVNRFTVRMALQKLNTIGLVNTKTGEGTFVTDFSLVAYLNEISEGYLDPNRMYEVTALRKLIEIECAQLACSFATDEELIEFEQAVASYLEKKKTYQYVSDTPNDMDAVIETDLGIHYLICKMSHNHLYRDIFLLIKPLVKQQVTYQITARNALWRQQGQNAEEDQHIPLLNAIKGRDQDACKRAYVQLIDPQEK
jgi:GntR family transcriptional regulator, transcriptional repressor for pyruvate dehydrogenase complex